MYCSHCGKKVEDMMLFCPFCGEAIVIPEQDDVAAPAEPPEETPQQTPAEAPDEAAGEDALQPVPEKTGETAPPEDAAAELLNWNRERRAIAGMDDEPAEEAPADFTPLDFPPEEEATEDWREDIARRKREAAPERHAPQVHRQEGGEARLEGHAPKLDESADGTARAHRSANTFVPAKALDPDDLFMNATPDVADEYDDYDTYDRDDDYDDDEDEYVYEDENEGSFFMRHIRGIVGLTLFFVLVFMFVIYAASEAGQRSLAKANLAWKADIYGKIGYEYYQEQKYEQAGLYYERALSRKTTNYSYASSAAMAYYTGGKNDKAVAMLKKCIEIDPARVEPYIYLLNIYPDAAQRPYDVTQLIRDGYEKTRDERLKIDN